MDVREALYEPPLLATLLAQNRTAIDEILTQIRPMLTGKEHCDVDEVFVLRFVLSHSQDALNKCKAAIAWRQAHSDKLHLAHKGILPKTYHEHQHDGFGEHSLGHFHGLFFIRPGLIDYSKFMASMPADKFEECLLLQHERQFMLADILSRRSGRLCKIIEVTDFAGNTIGNVNFTAMRAMGRASQASSLYFPQMAGLSVVINAPTWLSYVLKIARAAFSKASMDRIAACPGPSSGKPMNACPFLTKFANASDCVPDFLGGSGVFNDEFKA